MRSFIALLRRETWEHTTLKGLPVGLLIFVLLVNAAIAVAMLRYEGSVSISIDENTGNISDLVSTFVLMTADKQAQIINGTLLTISMVINSVILIMMFFYLIDSLYGERRDHSILFWKSLPVSDTQTVLSKLTVAFFIVPLIILSTTMLSQLITIGVQGYTLSHYPDASGLVWQHASLATLWALTVFLLIQQSIWYLPVMGWLLFCSAWSRKAPIIAAVLIPALLVFIDSSFLLRSGISEMILERLPIGIVPMQLDNSLVSYNAGIGKDTVGFVFDDDMLRPGMENAISFITNMKVWAGILVGTFFISMAIWLRRWRDDSL